MSLRVKAMHAAALAAILVLWGQPPGVAEESTASNAFVPTASEIAEVQLQHADSMTATQEEGKPQVFQGDVDIIVLDKSDNRSRLRATKVSIYYDSKTRQVDRIVAEGQVVITRDALEARSELAIYDGRENVVDLLKDNYVRDKRGELTADRIRVNLTTNEVDADGNVKGVVYPKNLEEQADGD